MKTLRRSPLLALLLLLVQACAGPRPAAVDRALESELQSIGFAPGGKASELEEPELELAGAPGARLFDIVLPPGDSGSINVGWYRNGATRLDPTEWLRQGYKGVRFIGAGVDVTHVRCTSWDGITVAVGRHAGIVRLENLTLHAGSNQATQFGEQNLGRTITPGFRVELKNVRAVVDSPETYRERRPIAAGEAAAYDGTLEAPNFPPLRLAKGETSPRAGVLVGEPRRPKWLLFAYNADLLARDCIFDARQAVEHAAYWHGFAHYGALVERCRFEGAGSQNWKTRSDATETAWAGPDVRIVIRDCTFRESGEPWTWRGPGHVVLEGAAAHVLIERCVFWGGGPVGQLTAKDRCKCVMISSEGLSYDRATGAVGTGFGNGHVLVRECVAYAASEVDWGNTVMRCGRNGGSQWSAESFTLEHVGAWGPKVIVQTGEVPTGRMIIRDCNAGAQVTYAQSIGMPTAPEATYPTAVRRVPLSEGIVR